MKLKAGYLIFILAILSIGVTAAFSASQKDEQAKSDPQKIIIDVSEIGDKIGVLKEETIMPDGKKDLAQKWGKAEIQKAMAELKRTYTDPKKTYLVTNSPHPAITLAFIQALQPLNVIYLYMKPGGDEVAMCTLNKVKNIPDPASNYGVRFEIKEDGDKIFMNFNSDSPEATALKQHTFDIKNTCNLSIPEIPPGKHLYLHARGRYAVMVPLAFNYIKDAKSISIARHEDDYTCAVSSSDKIQVGEVTKRTLPNNL
jgi:hypothetical protein